MKLFKRWREVPEEAEFTVQTDVGRDTASEAAEALLTLDQREDRDLPQHAGVLSLEGEIWTAHHERGCVFLSGQDGTVQAQFGSDQAYSLGLLLQEAGWLAGGVKR